MFFWHFVLSGIIASFVMFGLLYVSGWRMTDEPLTIGKWTLRFRWGYIKRYGFRESFAFGFVILGLLFYKRDDMVYYQYTVLDSWEADLSGYIARMLHDNGREKLFNSVPYDFVFDFVEIHQDFDIDYNLSRYVLEGFPRVKEKKDES